LNCHRNFVPDKSD